MEPRDYGRIARSLEPLHALGYFSPDVEEALVGAGLRKGRTAYFASRSAAMGRVGAGVVAATFYNFHPALVAKCVPAAWDQIAPEDAVAARYRGIDASYHRLLGAEVLASPEVAEAAELARQASEGCTAPGRPLYAGHADLAWPTEPHLVLFHALTLLREHRGDGHVAALLAASLSGLEALVTHCATGKGFVPVVAQFTRGWSDEEWAAATAVLVERGLLSPEGGLTDAGRDLRREVEAATDQMAAEPWVHLGAEGALRLAELGQPLVARALENGAFPDGVFAAG